MKERPIIFSAPMIRAILAGTKTQTRRIAKHPLAQAATRIHSYRGQAEFDCILDDGSGGIIHCPYGQPGDRLWVRETFAHIYRDNSRPDARRDEDVAYKADHPGLDEYAFGSWKPSIHMPRWASRITLEVTGVRVERLNDISEADALAEGIGRYDNGTFGLDDPGACMGTTAKVAYMRLWESINGPGSWDANPWVWVVEFQRAALAEQK